MSDGAIIAIAFVCIALLMIVVGYIGNKIVDKGSDAIRNKAVRKKNIMVPAIQTTSSKTIVNMV